MSRKFAVVTTFNQQGLSQYAQRFINSFAKNMPKDVNLYAYGERCQPSIPNGASNIITLDQERSIPACFDFKKKWKDDPRATGMGPDKRRLDAKKAFKWDAIKFCNKVYVVCDAARRVDADVLIWMDADSYIHSPMSLKFLDKFIPLNVFTCYAGRKNKYTECGWYSMNLKHPHATEFFDEFQRMYDDAENGIFLQKEWHDSYIYDVVRVWHEQEFNVANKDFSNGLIDKEGHPIINSELGAYIDHLKGDRKREGQSQRKDLKVERTEDYWKNIR
jgi:hypothetical protein